MTLQRGLLAAYVLAVCVAFASSDPWADLVADFSPGASADPDAFEALGAPAGGGLYAGSEEVTTLGSGGSLTLEFSSALFDGPGTDFIVQENPFFVLSAPATAFSEALNVEVSSNGADFARFPTAYLGPAVQVGPTEGVNPEWYVGYAGILPVLANIGEGIDPLDVVRGGGDAFDLKWLSDDPLVLDETVNLQSIRWVRLVDVDSGDDLDAEGRVVYDAGLDEFASADVDAVTATHHISVEDIARPEVELVLDENGFLSLRLYDIQGLTDITAGLTASVNGIEFDFYSILPLFVFITANDFEVNLLMGPIPEGMFQAIFKVSARDTAGRVAGDSVHIR